MRRASSSFAALCVARRQSCSSEPCQIWLARIFRRQGAAGVCSNAASRRSRGKSAGGFLTNLVVIPTQLCDGDTVPAFFRSWASGSTTPGAIATHRSAKSAQLYSGERRVPASSTVAISVRARDHAGSLDGRCRSRAEDRDAAHPDGHSRLGFLPLSSPGVAKQTRLRIQYDPTAVASAWPRVPCPMSCASLAN